MILITFSSKTSSIIINQSLFLKLLQSSSIVFPLSKFQHFLFYDLFPNHHSLYVPFLTPTNRAPIVFSPNLTFYRRYIFVFFFLTTHTAPYLFLRKLPTFQLLNLTSNFCNTEILTSLAHLRADGNRGPNLWQTFSEHQFVHHVFFFRERELSYLRPQF